MLYAIIVGVLAVLPGTAETFLLPAQEWAGSPDRQAVLSKPALRDFLRAADKYADAVLRIRYAGGENGTRRAEALRDALVALGVSSARIRLVPAAAGADELILEIATNGDTKP
jgi:hypothetical protein